MIFSAIRLLGLFGVVAATLLGFFLADEQAAFAQDHPRATCDGLQNCCDDLANPMCVDAVYSGAKVAIVFGSDEYDADFGSDLSDLKNGRNDAVTVGKALAKIGFDVRYVLDPRASRVRLEVTQFSSYLQKMDLNAAVDQKDARAVLYFASHGMSDGAADYLIFRPSNSVPTIKRFKAARETTEYLSSRFYGLGSYEVTLIFDACRTLTTLPTTAEGPFRSQRGSAFKKYEFALPGTEHIVVRTTSDLSPAVDVPTTGSTANGLFVREFSFFLGRPNMTPSQLFAFTSSSVYGAGFDQQPEVKPFNALKFSYEPWYNVVQPCATLEASLWKAAALYCRSENPSPDCHKQLCKVWNSVPAKTEADIACMRPEVLNRLDNLDTICALPPNQSAMIEIPTSPRQSIPNVAEASAIAVSSQPVFTQELPNIPTANRAPQEIRNEFVTGQATIGAGLVLAGTLSTDLKAWPDESADVVLSAETAASGSHTIRLDCETLKCGGGWAGLSVALKGKFYRGFVPASKLPIPVDGPLVEVRYLDASSSIPADKVEEMRAKLLSQGGATIAAFVAKDAPANERFIPEARLNEARLVVERAAGRVGIQPNKIVTAIIEVPDKGTLPDLAINFLKP